MNRDEVTRALKEIGDLLEIGEAGTFEVMAYRNGARALEAWEGDFAAAVRDGSLTEISGIGKGLSQVITELVVDGRSAEQERVRGLFPAGLPDLLTLPGLGPKKVRALWKALQVESLAELEAASRDGRVEALKGFGKKTVERVLATIERRQSRAREAESGSVGDRPSVTTGDAKKSSTSLQRPRASGVFRAGTSGFSFKGWVGTFYPKELRAKEYLAHYASRFPTVEINSTFYRFPSAQTLEEWRRQTPEGFRFAVKANRRITHLSRLKGVEDVVVDFVERCRVLGDRLGVILFQLPPTLKRDDVLLTRFLDGLPGGGRYALEFRHESWRDDSVHAHLRGREVALVVGDSETDVDREVSRELTTDFSYVRLRGEGYAPGDLSSWQTWFEKMVADKRDVFVYLKHDDDGATPETILGPWLSDLGRQRRWAPAARTTRDSKESARRKKA